MLSGCAFIKDEICGPPMPNVNTTIKVDPKLLEPCKPLLTMDKEAPGFEDYLMLTGDNALVYADCKKKQEASVLFIKKVSNGSK